MASNATLPKCPSPMKATSDGVWQGDNPINFAFPLLIIQICLVLFITRTLALLLKPMRQPRVIAEVIGGILLGPSALGRNAHYLASIFPKPSLTVLDTVANMGLLFFLFMVGLELDLKVLRRVGKQAFVISAAGIAIPFVAGVGVSFVLHHTIAGDGDFLPFLVFMGVAMSITAFPVLARILAERKLLTTDVGQLAMSAAAVDDVCAWVLLALAVALSGQKKSPTVAIWVLLCGVAYVIFMFVVTSPLMRYITRMTPEDEPIKETFICLTFAGVLVAGFTTDAIGIHAIFGAFVFGLVIPKEGRFATDLSEKLEDFVSVLMLPLYFASSGLKTNVATIAGAQSWGLLVLVIAVACVGKISGVFGVSYYFTRDVRKSMTLGVLMNTKGLVELIVLNIGKDKGVLNDEVFAIMVLMALVTTFMTTPIVMAIYKPARDVKPYNRRQLFMDASKDELRILGCVNGISHVPGMINLTELVRGQSIRTLRLYILHLMELSERSSAMMMVQRARRDGRPFFEAGGQGRTDNIVVAFEAFGQLSKVVVRPMTAISGYENMHEDICSTAEDKRAAMILIPFHKNLTDAGAKSNPDIRAVNRKVLQHAPCSVAMVLDRGLGGAAQIAPASVRHNCVILFFGGPDDREALAFGMQIAQHTGVSLKVIRFVSGLPDDLHRNAPKGYSSSAEAGEGHATVARSSLRQSSRFFMDFEGESESERTLDEAALDAIRLPKVETGDEFLTYEEIPIADLTEGITTLAVSSEYDFILVGRARRPSTLLAVLAAGAVRQHAEFPELGPVGEILTSNQIRASILVVQQYDAKQVGLSQPLGHSRHRSSTIQPNLNDVV
ncbi:K+:H+ antiporter [Marchantia polymorpha subsp. ruderalis]|uniref:Uncharacterized protein n=2 Tax=Marchantia polymorpha TaxID=3197 RepID=A0A176W4H5_MARPO|nr:hypothetical protein AXG93_4278s1050 [Marchantia polymorpha subsp. ruderalis]PTQ46337.1 hypothetical protein MARPO_0011s0034 [Marchantia polymorpha]BBN08301.1 hypothetical protein Mp_4g10470 [Marchantia polymorpha subsp. ruderalis]|eukprot:PTQ46337.1 hypothetical protein MARPO_0011s0034 [Marchantia polymorpha]